MKTCRMCGESKPLGEFYLYTTRAGDKTPMARCKSCHSAAVIVSTRKNPSPKRKADAKYAASVRHRRRLKRYGISAEEFAGLEASQQGVCLICQQFCGDMHVDHDHATGKVRGLLCPQCNVGLGSFRDDPARLIRAIAYLETV